MVARERPSEPLVCLRPAAITAAARRFVAGFPGDVLYAVKCNPEPRVLRAVWAGGVRHFDCASLPEIALVRRVLPQAEIHFMHPVKGASAINAAFHRYGVTDFAFDSRDELEKILQETVPVGLVGTPPTLGLFVRLAVAQGGALRPVRQVRGRLSRRRPSCCGRRGRTRRGSGIASMSARSASIRRPMRGRSQLAAEAVRCPGSRSTSSMSAAAFRSAIPAIVPPPLGDYIGAIGGRAGGHSATACGCGPSPAGRWSPAAARWSCRCSCGAATALYVNDGVYGSLSDAGRPGFRFPARLHPPTARGRRGEPTRRVRAVRADLRQRRPDAGAVPAAPDIEEGDWIELGQLGAYGACLRTGFNGFEGGSLVEVADPPMLTTPGYDEP